MRQFAEAGPLRVFHLFQLAPDEVQKEKLDQGDTGLRLAVMRARFGQIDDAIGRGLYRHVASLHARSEEDVFYKTRSLDGTPWTEGPRIIQAEPYAGETGVGDIVIDLEMGDAWMCASFGWEALSWDRCAQFIQFAAELGISDEPAERKELALEPA